MAFPTAVNSQITDAVTQSNVKVIGDAPADMVAQNQRAHEQIVAALTTSHQHVEEAMRLAEEAVTAAVHGATKAVDMAQQSTKKPEG